MKASCHCSEAVLDDDYSACCMKFNNNNVAQPHQLYFTVCCAIGRSLSEGVASGSVRACVRRDVRDR